LPGLLSRAMQWLYHADHSCVQWGSGIKKQHSSIYTIRQHTSSLSVRYIKKKIIVDSFYITPCALLSQPNLGEYMFYILSQILFLNQFLRPTTKYHSMQYNQELNNNGFMRPNLEFKQVKQYQYTTANK
jgi:hypothetical protein